MTSSLPAPGTPWPPAPYDSVTSEVDLRQAWWEGDIARLASIYRPKAAQPVLDARRFGASSTKRTAARPLHVPIAADLASAHATLIAGEPPTFTIRPEGGNDAARKRLDLVVNAPEFQSGILVGEESGGAIGDYYVRVAWDDKIRQHAWFDFVDGDSAFPTYRKGVLTGVLFAEELHGGGKNTVYRHLEYHAPGYIEHALYKGGRDNVGHPVPLAEHGATETLPVDIEGRIPTGTMRLTAAHIPNRRPNPSHRRDPILRHLGRPVLSTQVMPLMWEVNETYSSLARDVRLAKARLFIGESLLASRGAGQGSAFDADAEAYAVVRSNPDGDALIDAQQFAIRVDEHLSTADGYLRAILRHVGFSPLTFGLTDDAAAAMTATEVEAKSSGSSATKGSATLLRRHAFGQLAAALIEVDAAVFGTGAVITEDVEVEFTPAVKPSQHALSQTLQALDTARAVSTRTKVDMLHPDWDEQRREEEAARILAEQSGPALDDPFAIGADQDPTEMDTAAPELDEED